MKILYDHQAFTMQAVGGISRYFCELCNAYQQTRLVEVACALRYSDNMYLKEHGFGDIQPVKIAEEDAFCGGRDFPGKAVIYRSKTGLEQFERRLRQRLGWKVSRDKLNAAQEYNRRQSIRMLQTGDFDVFHPTYFDPYFLDVLGKKPFVLTIYDMTHEVYPEYFPASDNTSYYKRMLTSQAREIIAISEHTKNDIVTIFNIPAEKIHVVYLGHSMPVRPDAIRPPLLSGKIPERYLLFTGGHRTLYKNFYFAILAVAKLLHQDPHLQIVCTGPALKKRDYTYFEQLGLQGRIHHYATTTNMELAWLYKQAQAFIFPSLYEGFGMPILEAFACGCPVALSNTSSLPEIAGEAAIYFAPKNIHSIQEAVATVIYDNDLRAQLIARGYERVKHFSWEQTAQKTYEVYKQAIQ